MHVDLLDCGTMCPVGARWLGIAREIPCRCLFIESAAGLILVDTGYGLADLAHAPQRLGRLFCLAVRPRQSPEVTAIRQIEQRGYSAADVRHIVLTHLDHDHAGGLPDFPYAQVHVLEPEFQAAQACSRWVDRFRYCPAQWQHGPVWKLHSVQGQKWFGFESVQPVLPGLDDLLLVPLPGHSSGHCGVAVRRSGGWMLHAGDALFHADELNPLKGRAPAVMRLCQWFFQTEGRRVRENRERLRELANAQDVQVQIVCSHHSESFPPGGASRPGAA